MTDRLQGFFGLLYLPPLGAVFPWKGVHNNLEAASAVTSNINRARELYSQRE